MRVIFLDIDGVLNSYETIDRNFDYPELDPRNLQVLKQIVDDSEAKPILISSWKDDWTNLDGTESKSQQLIRYQMQEVGLDIFACTEDRGTNRGEGIRKWISENHPETWCVLDDQIFSDYSTYEILDHVVQSGYRDGGLQKKHIGKIMDLLMFMDKM